MLLATAVSSPSLSEIPLALPMGLLGATDDAPAWPDARARGPRQRLPPVLRLLRAEDEACGATSVLVDARGRPRAVAQPAELLRPLVHLFLGFLLHLLLLLLIGRALLALHLPLGRCDGGV